MWIGKSIEADEVEGSVTGLLAEVLLASTAGLGVAEVAEAERAAVNALTCCNVPEYDQ